MKMTRSLCFAAMVAVLALMIVQAAVAQDGREAEDRGLTGTWNVTLSFPVCSASCPCPGGTPNIPIPVLQQYERQGAFEEVGGFVNFRGPALGNWKHQEDHGLVARYKFFLFTPAGFAAGSEEVTSHIVLTGDDTFDATATFSVFNAAGAVTGEGCTVNATATRFK